MKAGVFMKELTGVVEKEGKKSFGEKSSVLPTVYYLFRGVLFAVLSAAMSGAEIFGGCSPFGIALMCACPRRYTAFCAAGAAIGYFIVAKNVVTLKYICALILALLVKNCILAAGVKNRFAAAGASAFLSTALSSALTCLIMDTFISEGYLYLSECLMCTLCALLYRNGFLMIDKALKYQHLSSGEITAVLCCVFLILTGTEYINVMGFSPARVIAVFIVLVSVYHLKIYGGVCAGAVAGISMSIAADSPFIAFSYALGGLLSGIAGERSKVLSGVSMCACAVATGFVWGADNFSFIYVYEAAAAAVMYIAVPKKLLNRLYYFSQTQTSAADAKTYRVNIANRLIFAGEALLDVSGSIIRAGESLSKLEYDRMSGVYKTAMLKTCDDCGLRGFCWDTQKDYTISVFRKIGKSLKSGKELQRESLPNDFGNRCIRPDTLVKNLNSAYSSQIYSDMARRRLREMRAVISGEFGAVGEMLCDLAECVEEKEIIDKRLTYEAATVFEAYSIPAADVVCTHNSSGRVKVQIHVPKGNWGFEDEYLLRSLNEAVYCKLEGPHITELGSSLLVHYFEKAVFKTQTGFCQINADSNTVGGDACEIFSDTQGRTALLLSDGMGKGEVASVDGIMAAHMLSKLIGAGFSPESSLKVVNSALMLKSEEESFATLDMACIDLFTGRVDFYKAGATCSFIRRKGKAGRVELASMPVGIIKDALFVKTNVTLSSGDIVLVVSDGVTVGSYDWVLSELQNFSHGTASELAAQIAKLAREKQYDNHQDDITVVCAFIE